MKLTSVYCPTEQSLVLAKCGLLTNFFHLLSMFFYLKRELI